MASVDTETIIFELDKLFPDVCPPIGSTIEEVCVKQGQVNVVRYLKQWFNEMKKYGGDTPNQFNQQEEGEVVSVLQE